MESSPHYVDISSERSKVRIGQCLRSGLRDKADSIKLRQGLAEFLFECFSFNHNPPTTEISAVRCSLETKSFFLDIIFSAFNIGPFPSHKSKLLQNALKTILFYIANQTDSFVDYCTDTQASWKVSLLDLAVRTEEQTEETLLRSTGRQGSLVFRDTLPKLKGQGFDLHSHKRRNTHSSL